MNGTIKLLGHKNIGLHTKMAVLSALVQNMIKNVFLQNGYQLAYIAHATIHLLKCPYLSCLV